MISGAGRRQLLVWNGSAVRQGRALDVSTPVNQFIYHSMLPQELLHAAKWYFRTLSALSALAVDLLDTILRERARRIL